MATNRSPSAYLDQARGRWSGYSQWPSSSNQDFRNAHSNHILAAQNGFIDRPKARSVSWPIFSSVRAHSDYLLLAGVAQLVEQRFRKPQVVRSIRIAGSIFSAT